MSSLILPKYKLCQDLIPVLIICKFEEDLLLNGPEKL